MIAVAAAVADAPDVGEGRGGRAEGWREGGGADDAVGRLPQDVAGCARAD